MTALPPSAERCAWCGAPLQLVWVHGHGQCAACGINCDPCCGGAAVCGNTAPMIAGNVLLQHTASGTEKGS